ncbi:MAG TPA: AI-2E family transporter [Acidimicrobiia bacterium]|nr:AI-2E family transporter [Acidimicrobiia bacterium]
MSTERPVRHVVVDIAPRSVVFALLVVMALVLADWMLTDIPAVLIRSALGIFLALALNPVVDAAMRRLRIRRAVAVTAVVGGFLVAATAFGVLAVPRAVNQLSQVGDQVSGVISDLDTLPAIGRTLRENGVDERVADFLDNLPDTLATRDKALRGIVSSAGDGLVTVFWVLLVAITALLDGPRLAGELRDVLPERFHAEVNHFGDLAYKVIGRYAAGTGFVAVVNAAAVTTIGLMLGTPLAPLVGVWSGLWNIVPQIGGFMGGATLVALSLTRGLHTGLIAAGCFLVYQQVENNVLQPVITGRTIKISPLANMTAVLAGAAAGGFVGALLANPILAIGKAFFSEYRLRTGGPVVAGDFGVSPATPPPDLEPLPPDGDPPPDPEPPPAGLDPPPGPPPGTGLTPDLAPPAP